MLRMARAVAIAAALLLALPAAAQALPVGSMNYRLATDPPYPVVHRAAANRAATYKIERWLGQAPAPYPGSSLFAVSYERRLYLLGLWQDRHAAAYRAWEHAIVPLVCIHGGEGSWSANTGNGYYGGLQMNLAFQESWGPWLLHTKGTADHWTANEQLRVGYRAVLHIGYGPWPNTRIPCGV